MTKDTHTDNDQPVKNGYWWPEDDGTLPSGHKTCNDRCRKEELIHYVLRSELLLFNRVGVQPTKSSGELEEILYTFATEIGREALKDNMSAARFEFSAQKAKAAIEALHTTQTTKLQAEAFVEALESIKMYQQKGQFGCNWESMHPEQAVPITAIDSRIAYFRREHKIGEDGDTPHTT